MKFLTTGAVTLFVLLTLRAGTASAQTAGTGQPPPRPAAGEEIEQLPEIVVSASRVPLEAKAVGSAVTLITAEEIERKQARVVSDLLREVPGVAVHRSGPLGTQTAVRIRGGETGHTLVIIDGVKVNDPADGNATYNFGHLLTSNVERIEVLRGPQSGLYGSDAIGGVINIVTRKGRGPATARLGVEGGSFGTANIMTGFQGGGEGYHFSLSATGYRTSGISIAPGPEKDGYRNQTYNARFGLELMEDLELELTGRYVRTKLETDGQSSFGGATPDDGDETDGDRWTGRTQLKYGLFDGAWSHAAGVTTVRMKRDFFDDSAGSHNRFDGRRLHVDYETNVFFDTSAGIEATHAVTFLTERGKDSHVTGDTRPNFTNQSYSGEYQMGVADRLFLSGGVRHDDNERFKNTSTYRLTAAYLHTASGTRLHGSYGTGVKNPTLSHSFQRFGRLGPNPDVQPEKSKGWDIGVEQDLLEGRLSTDLTYFNSRPTDLIYWNDAGTTDFNDDFYDNLEGTSRIRGVEFSVKAKPAEGVSLAAQYTYTDAKDAQGRPLRRRAKHIASANAGYDLLNGRAAIDLGIDYNGKQVDQYHSPKVPSYVLVNLAGKYSVTKGVEFFGRIENLFDKDYYELRSFEMREFQTTGIGFFAGIRGTFELPR